MTRITKLQKSIFDAHLEAAKSDSFDMERIASAEEFITAMESKKTVKGLWTFCWDRASITSQLMASPTFNHFSGNGIKTARDEMKRILNDYKIN